MPESGTYGSERGVLGNGHPYRDPQKICDFFLAYVKPSRMEESPASKTGFSPAAAQTESRTDANPAMSAKRPRRALSD